MNDAYLLQYGLRCFVDINLDHMYLLKWQNYLIKDKTKKWNGTSASEKIGLRWKLSLLAHVKLTLIWMNNGKVPSARLVILLNQSIPIVNAL